MNASASDASPTPAGNRLKSTWDSGGSTVGVWISLPSPVTAEVVAQAGFDYVCVDGQHGILDYQAAAQIIQVLNLGDAVPIARVPWNEPGVIGKMLDAGAKGIIIPMVNSVAEAVAAVRACRYAPLGARSYGPTAVMVREPSYYATANDVVACIPMIETVEALSNIDEILTVPGIDAIYVGPADLSITLGLPPGNNDGEPAFDDALATIVDRCRAHGVPAGIHASPALTQRRLDMGFSMVTATSDLGALKTGLDQGRRIVEPDSAPDTDSMY